MNEEIRFIPPTEEEEHEKQQLKTWFGQCYDCRHHLRTGGGVCILTRRSLRYPISGCPEHEPWWSFYAKKVNHDSHCES